MIWVFLLWFQGGVDIAARIEAAVGAREVGSLMAVYKEMRPEGSLPEDERALNRLGYKLLRNRKNDQAIAVFRLNTKLFPHRANPLDSLAEGYLLIGLPAQAAKWYQRAFEKEPNRDYWRRAGNALLALGDEAKLLSYVERGIQRFPDAESYDLWLSTKIRFKKTEDPAEEFRKVAEMFPGSGLWQSKQALVDRGITIDALDDGWISSSYAAEGLDSTLFDQLSRRIEKGEFDKFHGLVVTRENAIIGEVYGSGFARFRKQDTQSAGKSVLALLVGLAVDKQKIKLEDPVYDFFPEYRQKPGWDSKKDGIQVRHLLTMSSGLDAYDDRPKSPGREALYQRFRDDWLDPVLRVPMAFEPGSQLVYASANYFILGEVLSRAVGQPLDAFANESLFAPMGIQNVQWFRAPGGQPYGAGGVLITPRDLAKIGNLVLNQGRWKNKTIVSSTWIKEMTKPQVKGRYRGREYGYGWYYHEFRVKGRKIKLISASGNGGQRIWVMPDLRAVVVITMGNYNSLKARQADTMFGQYIVPSLME